MVTFLESPLVKALISESIPFHEVMNAFDIKTSIAFNLSSFTYGFVYTSRQNCYHIVLNGNMNYETQCKTFIHELKHIVTDIPEKSYIIGVNMQHCPFEIEAENAILK